MTDQTTLSPRTGESETPHPRERFGRTARVAVTLAATAVLAGISVGYILLGRAAEEPEVPPTAQPVSVAPGPRLLTLMSNGQVTTVDSDDPGGRRLVSQTKCDRIYAAAGTAACLYSDGVLGKVTLSILDQDLRPRDVIPVAGVPSRVRVSASGRMVAWTAFVGGDDYATLDFSTRTGIYDTHSGMLLKSLESFAVTREGEPYQAADINYWGVTFARDDNTFYATMYTDGHRYLVQGDLAARTVRTVRDHVECPSLSPDGTRIAFKAAVDGNPARGWRLAVLDLATQRVTDLTETRSVDDQAAWLDNDTLAYALSHADGIKDLWTVPADGSGEPTLLLRDAHSPTAL